MAKQITEEMKQKAWEYGRKSKDHYNVLTDEQKKAFWEYGQSNKLYDANKLDDYKRGEYNKYLSSYTGDKRKDAETFRSKIPSLDRKGYETEYKKYSQAIADKPSGNRLVDTLNRIGQVGANVFIGSTPKDYNFREPISTGSKGLDVASDFIGSTMGFIGGSKAIGSQIGSSKGLIGEGTRLGERILPKLGRIGTSRIGQELVKGASAGAVLDVAQGLKENDSVKDLALRVGRGALIGAPLDLAGYGISQAFLKKTSKQQLDDVIETIVKKENVTREEVEAQINKLLLPAAKEAEPRMVGKNEVIYASGGKPIPPKPLALTEGNDTFISKGFTDEEMMIYDSFKNQPNIKQSLKEVSNEFNKLVDDALESQYQYLKSNMGKGTEPLDTFLDEWGEPVKKWGRISNNDQWYRDFFAKNSRKPTQKELRDLAREHLINGFDIGPGMKIPPDDNFIYNLKMKETLESLQNKISSNQFKTQIEVPRRIDDILPKDIKKPDSLYTAKQRIRVPQIRQGTGTVDDPFRWEVPNGQAQKEATSTVETLRANIEQPNKIDLQQEDTPIDTMSKVLTENPKRAKVSLSDRAERVYQEVFSTKVPFEKMGGVARTQGSNLNRVQGTIEYNVVGKQVNMQGEEIGKSVVDIFSDVPKETKKGLFDYILNSHNIDRFREGKPVFGETVTSEMSASKIAEYDKMNPTFKSKQQEITKYFKNLMDEWAVKSGLVSKETASMLNDRYANYVPTYRAKDLPKSMMDFNSNVSQMIKKAKGSEDYILPIDQQMIAMTERTIKNARKNELMNTIASAFESGDTSASRYIREIKSLPKESIDDLLDVGKYLDEVPVLKGDEYLVNFYTNGEPRQMVVNKVLYKALDDSVSDNAMYTVARVVKKYATQPFKNLITGYNPIFAASNIMRDVPTALTYSSNPIKMSANVPNAVEQMLKNGDDFKMFKALGGTREGLFSAGKEFKVPNLNETSKAFKAAQKLNPIKTIGDINNFAETLPRFAEFLAVLDETNDPALAIYRSAELTTDFARNGKLIKYLDNFVPYLNPSVQGFNKFFRGLKESPLKTIAKGATVITIPTIILDQINKDNSDYNNLPPRERNLYFNIPIPNSNEFIRIPKSRELGVVFSSVYEWAARASRGQEVTGKEIAQAIGENFTPSDVTAPIWTPAQKAWRQIANPEAYETNYWGGLIVPESQRQYSPGQQYDANSSGIAKAIGQQFNISPFVVDYLIKSYGGVVGQTVQPIGAGTTTNTFEALTIEPWKKKFVNDAVFKSNSVNKFYDELAKAKKEAQDYNKINNVDSKVVTSLERDANSLNKIATEISKLRKEQKELEVIKGNEDKVKALQAEINRMAQRALENRNKK